jgi:hypothetical protein
MFGRAVRSTLGNLSLLTVDYDEFEESELVAQEALKERWDYKYHAKPLPALVSGQRVWVNAPTENGREGVVVRSDSNPDSYWVRVGLSELRRNRKHLFILHDECSNFRHESDDSLSSLFDGLESHIPCNGTGVGDRQGDPALPADVDDPAVDLAVDADCHVVPHNPNVAHNLDADMADASESSGPPQRGDDSDASSDPGVVGDGETPGATDEAAEVDAADCGSDAPSDPKLVGDGETADVAQGPVTGVMKPAR